MGDGDSGTKSPTSSYFTFFFKTCTKKHLLTVFNVIYLTCLNHIKQKTLRKFVKNYWVVKGLDRRGLGTRGVVWVRDVREGYSFFFSKKTLFLFYFYFDRNISVWIVVECWGMDWGTYPPPLNHPHLAFFSFVLFKLTPIRNILVQGVRKDQVKLLTQFK